MNSAQIDSFLQIADVGSFSKAEDLLHITKTALKRQIDRLEDELGFHLFIRNASGLILTDAGAEFYKRMKAIVADCRTLVADCQRIDLSAKLVIRIGMYKISQMWSWYLRLEKAASIRIEQQLIPFNPVVTDTIAMLRDKKIDFLECDDIRLFLDEGLCYKNLYVDNLCCLVSPIHEFASRSTITLNDIAHSSNVYCWGTNTTSNALLHQKAAAVGLKLTSITYTEKAVIDICSKGGIFILSSGAAATFAPMKAIQITPLIPFYKGLVYLKENELLLEMMLKAAEIDENFN